MSSSSSVSNGCIVSNVSNGVSDISFVSSVSTVGIVGIVSSVRSKNNVIIVCKFMIESKKKNFKKHQIDVFLKSELHKKQQRCDCK